MLLKIFIFTYTIHDRRHKMTNETESKVVLS